MRINKLKLKRNNIVWLPVLMLLAACSFNENTVYYSYLHTPGKGWTKKDTLVFPVPVADSLKPYKVRVEIRNQAFYPYEDLYLLISHNTEDSTIFITDTMRYALADKSGKWVGTGLGTLYQNSFSYYKFIPPHPGKYVFKVTHGMKDEALQGITDIGLKVDRE